MRLAAKDQQKEEFQSTLPVRGGTPAPLGRFYRQPISIHPPRVGRDVSSGIRWPGIFPFQSTLPVRGGTP